MRIDQLTFTRFVAAISIVIFHFAQGLYPFNLYFLPSLLRHAYIGVSYFFILSGFVMVIAYYKRGETDYGEFFKRRFARIYPVYFFAAMFFLSYFLVLDLPVDHKGMIKNLLLIQSWIPGNAMRFNSPGWSLCVEAFFYLVFPFLLNHFYLKKPLKTIVWPILIFFVISQVVFYYLYTSSFYDGPMTERHDLVFYFPPMHLNEFLIGNLAGLYFVLKGRSRNYDIVVITLFALFIWVLTWKNSFSYHNGMMAVLFVPLILFNAMNNGWITKLFSKKPFIFLGEISYGIYILQAPVYFWMKKWLDTMGVANDQIHLYLPLVVLIIIAALSYQYLETPLRKKINQGHWKLPGILRKSEK